MNRLNTPFGNDGFTDPPSDLLPFSALYRFQDRTFTVTVWARSWSLADQHCHQHGLKLDGQILERVED